MFPLTSISAFRFPNFSFSLKSADAAALGRLILSVQDLANALRIFLTNPILDGFGLPSRAGETVFRAAWLCFRAIHAVHPFGGVGAVVFARVIIFIS